MMQAVVILLICLLPVQGGKTKKPTSAPSRSSVDKKKKTKSPTSRPTVEAKPNIIFLLADDLAWGSGGFTSRGESDLDFVTPNLNRLAAKGVKFSQYYSQEVCTPARASLMTGRYPLSIGMQYGGIEATSRWGLNMSETLFPEVLKSKGLYTNYQIGKWNLGHFTAKLLPTARGFNYYMGYNSGSMFPWSKKDPNSKKTCKNGCEHDLIYFKDLTYGDGSCYSVYSGTDQHDYSTFLFRDKAINTVTYHDYDSSPLFMYIGFQAVHDPFDDFSYPNGMPKKYLDDSSMYGKIKSNVVGRKRRQYAMSLYLLDSAVQKIVDAVDDVGQSDNTYFIFASDNGGCYDAGGRNGPLRGNKGNLFEGGTKVDAFLYSAKLSSKQQGSTYSGLFHVSDWFPTIMDMTGISFTAEAGYELDGVSHWSNIKALDSSDSSQALTSPRTVMLYNYYDKVQNVDGWGDTPVRAVRDSRYKLIETWSNTDSGWFFTDQTLDDDSDLANYASCTQPNSWQSGTFTQFLFDLQEDPYEETNLFGLPEYQKEQALLYEHFDTFIAKAKIDYKPYDENNDCYKKWKVAGNTIVPWEKSVDEGTGAPAYVKAGCDYSLIGPSVSSEGAVDDAWVDTKPTDQPTQAPSKPRPTFLPTLQNPGE